MTNTATTAAPAPTTAARPSPLRPVLWVALVLAGIANVVTSAVVSLPIVVGIGCGLLTAGFATALFLDYRRTRSAR